MQFSSHRRNRVAPVDDVVRTVARIVEGIRRLLNIQSTEKSCSSLSNDIS